MSRFPKLSLVALASLTLGARTARAQYHPPGYAVIDTEDVRRSGPRYGALWLSDSAANYIAHQTGNNAFKPSSAGAGKLTSVFGWEFETQLLQNPTGATPVSDLVLVVAGLDQGTVLPSATWLVGMRLGKTAGLGLGNAELGIGPNVTAAGAGLALTAGITHRSGAINIPLDLAAVDSKLGWRVSLTTGFNVMK